LIGMVLLRPGWEGDYEGRPPVYPIGCTGVITHAERLQDGRYNIVLRGVERFRIVQENAERAYRRAIIETFGDRQPAPNDRADLRICRSKLESLLAAAIEKFAARESRGGQTSRIADPRVPASMQDEDLVNALAQYLDLEPLEKQALLEQPSLCSRAASLVELL